MCARNEGEVGDNNGGVEPVTSHGVEAGGRTGGGDTSRVRLSRVCSRRSVAVSVSAILLRSDGDVCMGRSSVSIVRPRLLSLLPSLWLQTRLLAKPKV